MRGRRSSLSSRPGPRAPGPSCQAPPEPWRPVPRQLDLGLPVLPRSLPAPALQATECRRRGRTIPRRGPPRSQGPPAGLTPLSCSLSSGGGARRSSGRASVRLDRPAAPGTYKRGPERAVPLRNPRRHPLLGKGLLSPHFSAEETEARSGGMACPRSRADKWHGQYWNSGAWALTASAVRI